MTVDEFGQLAAAIKTFFPRDNMLPTNKAMDLWFDMLKDLTYESAYAALKKHVASSRFPPTIADIREGAADFTVPNELNEMEAWSLVYRAICNSTYNSVSEFEKLPTLVQKAVGLPDSLREWAMTENLNLEVVSSNFIKTYRNVIKQNREMRALPNEIREKIESNSESTKYITVKEPENKVQLIEKIVGVPMPDSIKEKYKEILKE